MSGFIGIKDNVVFKLFLVILCYTGGCVPTYALNFESNHRLNSTEDTDQTRILIFINPQCSWCQRSLENVSSFKRRNPRWLINIYVMATVGEFINFFHDQMGLLPSNLEYSLDLNNSVADMYGITQTPTYIMINHGQVRKVEGYVDLAHFNLSNQS